jgi:transposase
MTHELHTLISALLPSTSTVHLTALTIEQDAVVLQLTAAAPTASCPCCAVPSSAVHSRYQRHLTDLPWGTLSVRIQLMVRKFKCRQPTCRRRIFTERLPEFATTYARNTTRLITTLRTIGVTLGGNAGARLAARLRLSTSAATLLRLIRGAPIPPIPALQAVGVDEWAWRRGHRYGTIMVDLLTHRVVDLLPDRSAATVAAWLAQHPTIIVVCRDRSDLYADGIRRGAPAAVQVIDRFHLVHNLRQALEAFLIDHRAALQAAAASTAQALLPRRSPVPMTGMYQGRRQISTKGQLRAEAARERRNAPRVAAYQAVHTLHARGTSIAAIARALGVSRPTVYAYLRRHAPPSPKQPHWRPSTQVLMPFVPYLIRRWRETGADSMQLWREIQARGYTHSARTVCRFITRLRRAADAGQPPESQRSPYTGPQGPSARAVSFAMVCPAAQRSPEAQTSIDQLCQMDTDMARAHSLIQAFLTMVRERRGDHLEAWMAEAVHSGVEALARFARGLQYVGRR